MTRTLFTAAAATLLAGTAFLASFDDAEARGRAGDGHRMSNSVRHAGVARGGIARANHGARTNHVARAKNAARANHVSKGQHAGQSTRRGGNVGRVSPRNNHQGPNANQLGNRQGPNQQAGGASTKTGNLSPGPRSNNETQGRVFRNEMGPMNNNTNNNTPQANNPQANNNTPQQNGNMPQTTGKNGPLANGPMTKGSKTILINKGKIPWVIEKGIDFGITYAVPVYGPAKSIYNATTIKPKIEQTLENSALSQQLHDEKIKAEEEAAKARAEQGGGVFSPNLNDPALMDP